MTAGVKSAPGCLSSYITPDEGGAVAVPGRLIVGPAAPGGT